MSAPVVVAAPKMAEPIVRAEPARERLESVDLLRGLVIVIMALDHVRDFFSFPIVHDPVSGLDVVANPTDLLQTHPALFFTRWITHYCAPTFIFLAGTGAFLSRPRWRSRSELSWFLLTRGLWLALLELTVIRVSWMANFDPHHHGAGVFWPIGLSMIILAGLVYLPTTFVTTFGIILIAYHNLLDGMTHDQVGLPDWLWVILHRPGEAILARDITIGKVTDNITFGTGYCLVPWCGVMAAGYGFGALLRLDRATRRRELFGLGVALTLAFVALRAVNLYGDANRLTPQPNVWKQVMDFLNCTKYPPSLLYLLMTLGPAILVLAVFDRPLGPLARPIITFGRVPLFFYLLHIPLIHGAAVLYDFYRYHGWSPMATDGPWGIRPGVVPEGYGVSLLTVYFLWIGVLLVLYPPCHWYAGVKKRSRSVWLSYL
jgi:uncharacterized membrane protein